MKERCSGSIWREESGSRRDSQSAVSYRNPFDQASDVTAKELEIGSRELASDSWRGYGYVLNLTESTFNESMCARAASPGVSRARCSSLHLRVCARSLN